MLKIGVAAVVCPNITDYWATLEDPNDFCNGIVLMGFAKQC